ncbi:MAG: S1/P1 nuclease [Bacteroidota bacterium]|nr:S1/P1 nuclease [Bacteroidota bacterium]MDP4217791.1 S1/P1 nuclease [Bacteroidota bacterium]MDP4246811.1 S1/P1 nuclease [Bacteroidota bacterium]MDP4255706.1 S1/P1 nuclease [Bacteroidota bacterium]MDP4258148.1 S1/P1 nuclease [Bacteroidota bacterium]
MASIFIMKKLFSTTPWVLCSVLLVSWGVLGHRTVAKIAEAHLTANARLNVHYYLGDQTMPEVSTYADEIRSHEEFRYTGPWHYIDLPMGYTYQQFSNAVREMKEDNVYKALLKCETDLRDPTRSKDEKAFALKFVIHLVGDLHQPMHVSRAEDKGGNSIKVTFEGQDANLHSLWDSRLIEHQNLSFEQLAERYDRATPEQIRKWQSDDLMKWLFESYQVSAELYADAARNPNFDEAYYQAHLPVIARRIEQAGIRLAGVLNSIFTAPPPSGPVSNSTSAVPASSSPASSLSPGSTTTLCDKVYTTRYFESSQMTLLNVGAAYPNQKLTIMIKGEDRGKFKVAPETAYANKSICVTGVVTEYRGKPEIIVTDPGQITVKD